MTSGIEVLPLVDQGSLSGDFLDCAQSGTLCLVESGEYAFISFLSVIQSESRGLAAFGEFNDPIPGPLCIVKDRRLSFDFAGSQADLLLDLFEVRVCKV